MANVKLKELPRKSYDQVENNNLFLVEDSTNSSAISLKDLKQVFSVDDKLLQMKSDFQSMFDTFTYNIQTPLNELDNRVTALERRADGHDTQIADLRSQLQTVAKQATLPVGAIFYSNENKVNPNDILAGTWENIGYSTFYDDADTTHPKQFYIYTRIS